MLDPIAKTKKAPFAAIRLRMGLFFMADLLLC